jgi:hypothetical protein
VGTAFDASWPLSSRSQLGKGSWGRSVTIAGSGESCLAGIGQASAALLAMLLADANLIVGGIVPGEGGVHRQ